MALEEVAQLFMLGDQVGPHHHGIIRKIACLHFQHQALVRRPEASVLDLDEGKFFLKRLVDFANFFFIKIGAPGNLAFLFGARDDRGSW